MKKLIIIIPIIFMLLAPLGGASAFNVPDTPSDDIYNSNNDSTHEIKEKRTQSNKENKNQTEKMNQILAGACAGLAITLLLSLISETVIENGETQTECRTYNNGEIIGYHRLRAITT